MVNKWSFVGQAQPSSLMPLVAEEKGTCNTEEERMVCGRICRPLDLYDELSHNLL